MKERSRSLALTAALLLAPVALGAQQAPPSQTPASKAPTVGALAPDFALPGATRYGVLADSVRLSQYRGNTVVLAFFFRARSKG